MATLRGRDGKTITATGSRLNNLLKSGFYQLVAEPQAPAVDPFAGTIYSNEFGYNPSREGTGTAQGNKDFVSFERDSAVGQEFHTGKWDDFDNTEYSSYRGPRDGKGTDWTHELHERWDSTDLTASEQQEFVRYMTALDANPGAFWDIKFTAPDADGFMSVESWSPHSMTQQRMEDDSNSFEWSDKLTNVIEDAMKTGPGAGADFSDMFDTQPTNGGGGGGGGGGRVGPVYASPDRGVVEDTVKAMLTSLTGDEPDDKVQAYTDEFLRAHKNSWSISQSGGEIEDPNQTVLELIRGQENYKRIHTNRSESDSETRWISDRVGRLNQLGMDSVDADERGVWLAQAGTNLNDIDIGKAQNSKGKDDISMMGKIQKAATLVAGQL